MNPITRLLVHGVFVASLLWGFNAGFLVFVGILLWGFGRVAIIAIGRWAKVII